MKTFMNFFMYCTLAFSAALSIAFAVYIVVLAILEG